MNVRPAAVRISRYRPYIVAVVAVAIVVVVPARTATKTSRSAAPAQAAAPAAIEGPEVSPGGVAPAAAVTASADLQAAPTGGTIRAATTSTTAANRTPAPGQGKAAAASATAPGQAAAVAYPGVGTPAALANPKCDKGRGRMMFPDFYAPPCVVPWPAGADNGGATSPGVDAKTIRVVVYDAPQNTDAQRSQYEQIWKDYFDGVNRTFELWGRQIKLSFYYASGTDEVSQRADAIQVANLKPFYVTTAAGAPEVFGQEMAARGVIVMGTFGIPWTDSQKQAPYRWSFSPDDRALILPILEYVGKRLAAHPTKWAGDATLNGKPRVFGIVQPTTWDDGYVRAEAGRQHVTLVDSLTYDEADTPGAQERARTVISKLKADGVTSVIDGAALIFNIALTKEATAQLYFPEWVITGYSFQDTVIFARLFDQQQWAHAFGVGTLGPIVPPEKIIYYTDYVWFTGHAPSDNVQASYTWPDTIVFALGVTLAGPHLTPQTYRNGLFSFPPSAGTWCGCRASSGMSFGRHIPAMPWDDYSGWEDVTEKWWDPSYRTIDELGLPGTGAWMKVDGGKRYLPGQQPTTEPHVFDPNGAIQAFEDWPASEAPPSYPPPPR